jgi:outer membrane receptor protein involved in Fe transport
MEGNVSMRARTKLSPVAAYNLFALLPFAAGSMASPAYAQARVETDRPAATTAQEPNSEIGDIVVTAQKRSESLQRVPLSVVAVSGDLLKSKQWNSSF